MIVVVLKTTPAEDAKVLAWLKSNFFASGGGDCSQRTTHALQAGGLAAGSPKVNSTHDTLPAAALIHAYEARDKLTGSYNFSISQYGVVPYGQIKRFR